MPAKSEWCAVQASLFRRNRVILYFDTWGEAMKFALGGAYSNEVSKIQTEDDDE